MGIPADASEIVHHLANCPMCTGWLRECGRRETIVVSQDGTHVPFPAGREREDFLCATGRELIPAQHG